MFHTLPHKVVVRKFWKVMVDVDANGGDDDVFEVVVNVAADDRDHAFAEAERIAAEKYGRDNVLGAYRADERYAH